MAPEGSESLSTIENEICLGKIQFDFSLEGNFLAKESPARPLVS
jgi:hypothetical protein